MAVVATIDPIKVLRIFDTWEDAQDYAKANPDHFLSASKHETREQSITFAKYLQSMTPDYEIVE